MKKLSDVTCNRCQCTTSFASIEIDDIAAVHVCPDGERSDSFSVSTRIVPGPGERSKDSEKPN